VKPLISKFKKWFILSRKDGEQGFTLIELLIVIAVLGALASVVVPNVASFMGVANIAAANTEILNVKTATNVYLADSGTAFPASSDNLTISGGGSVNYLSGTPKAKYTFNTTNGLVTQVDALTPSGGWTDIVFDLSEQKWVKGADDGTGGSQDRS